MVLAVDNYVLTSWPESEKSSVISIRKSHCDGQPYDDIFSRRSVGKYQKDSSTGSYGAETKPRLIVRNDFPDFQKVVFLPCKFLAGATLERS